MTKENTNRIGAPLVSIRRRGRRELPVQPPLPPAGGDVPWSAVMTVGAGASSFGVDTLAAIGSLSQLFTIEDGVAPDGVGILAFTTNRVDIRGSGGAGTSQLFDENGSPAASVLLSLDNGAVTLTLTYNNGVRYRNNSGGAAVLAYLSARVGQTVDVSITKLS